MAALDSFWYLSQADCGTCLYYTNVLIVI